MQTPWINRKEMEEIIAKQTNKFMRFLIKPIELECVCETKEDIESSSKLRKRENRSKQTGDPIKNKEREEKNDPVNDKNRNNSILESKINQNDRVVDTTPIQPASSEKYLNVQRVKLSSLQKPLSKAKEIAPNSTTVLQANANDNPEIVSDKVSIDEEKQISGSKTSHIKFNNFSEQISLNEEKMVTEAIEEQAPFSEENVRATLEKNPSPPQPVQVTAEADIVEDTPIQENEPIYADKEHLPSYEENVMTVIEEGPSTSHQIKVTEVNEEQPPYSEENVITATEEDPSTSHQIKITAEATFIENPLIETIIEMGYDQTNPPLSEESGQEQTFHVDKVGIDEEKQITCSKTSYIKFNDFSEQISPIEENMVTEAIEDQTPFSEENVMTSLEQNCPPPQLVEITAEADIVEYTPIQENEPVYADEECIPSYEEHVMTVIEEDPSSLQKSEDTAEATFVENASIETIVEMGYDQTNPPLSEESGQENTFHVDKVGIDEKKQITCSKTFQIKFNDFSEQISPIEENMVTEAIEDQTPISEENVITSLEQNCPPLQLVEITAEADIVEYTPIQENEPVYADEERIPSYEENLMTVIEEDPSSLQKSEDTAEATLVENASIETIVEMGYDQTTPPLSEDYGQENTFHVGKVGGLEQELTIPVSSDKVKTYLEDQESQKKSNDHKEEEQLIFSKDLSGINDLKRNQMITATDFLNVQIPVILGKYNIEICLEDEEIFAEKVKEIREISKKVVLKTCKFIPSEFSPVLDNGSCKALKGNLMIEGIIQQDIKYVFENQQTSNYTQNHSTFNQLNQKNSMHLRKHNFGRYSYVHQPYPTNNPNPAFELQTKQGRYSERLISSMSKTIPFSSVVEINHFLHPPLFGSIEEKSFTFQNNMDQQMSNTAATQFISTTYYPENTQGKLIYSRIHDNINFFKHEEKYIKTPKIKLKQFIVLELLIHLLQEQSVQVQMPRNGFNLSPPY